MGEESTLRIESAGTRGSMPLTAGGKLTLNAANIEQNGTLLAPFGTIEINATESLALGAGSLTSVSGDGALIPFGRVENGTWIYQDPTERSVWTTIPERRIDLRAPNLQQDANATVDLREGGKFSARMEARDGSEGFDFAGVYTKVVPQERIEYRMEDGRTVKVEFIPVAGKTHVKETFEAESENEPQVQRQGWQRILNRFAHHVEAKATAR